MKLFQISLSIFIIIFCIIIFFYAKNNLIPEQDINYLFWTGGYDSTFRLCELIIIENKYVQPIYINYNLDSVKKTDLWVRRNRKQEKIAMNKVREFINENYPYKKHLLLETIFINNEIKSRNFEKAFSKENLFPKKRKVHQYVHMAKIAYYKKKYIETGVLGLHLKSKFIKFIYNNIDDKTYNLNIPKSHTLHYLKFPLLKRSKKDLCSISKKYNFEKALSMSWSCWFPNPNEETCGRCPMCRERFKCQ